MPATGYVVQQVFNALIVGSFYSLLAVSYALVHGLTNRIVLSFGDMAMFCAFSSLYAALAAMMLHADSATVLAAALVGSTVSGAALGFFSLKAVFAPLMHGRSQTLLIASLGLGLVLQEVMRLQSGGREQWLEPMLSDAVLQGAAGGFTIRISAMQLLIIGATAAFLLAMGGTLRWSKLGRLWRACSEDAPLASLIGINVRKVTALTFVIAAVYAGAVGFTLAIYYGGVSFYMGLMLGLKALFASIIGGFGTVGGAVAGAFVLAFLETAWAAFFPISYRDPAVFAVVLSLLIIRPEGLLGARMRRDYER